MYALFEQHSLNKMYTVHLFLLINIFLLVVCNETTTDTEIITASVLPDVTQTPPPPPANLQPSQSQTQHVNVAPHEETNDAKNFKPSPHLETFFEYNRFPVRPAHPEPKIFGTVEKVPINNPWQQEQQHQANNVRFPLSAPITVNDHPYPYTKDVEKSPTSYPGYAHTLARPTTSLSKIPISSYGKPSKAFHEEESAELTPSHWKKLIKILTAFIPIGLLISALTPSVITIGPANGTTYRARSDDKKQQLLSNLNINKECDERIFCELLLSAEQSKNSDRTINNLLENYMLKNGSPDKLQNIYKAIRNGNCSSLHCDRIKNPKS